MSQSTHRTPPGTAASARYSDSIFMRVGKFNTINRLQTRAQNVPIPELPNITHVLQSGAIALGQSASLHL